MKKILNLCVVLTSLIGYLEWGTDNSAFLGQTEYELIFGAKSLQNMIHPFVIVPLAGQLLLLITLFQKTPSRLLSYIGLASLSLLLVFIFIIGAMTPNFKMLASTIPFIISGILVLRYNRRSRSRQQGKIAV